MKTIGTLIFLSFLYANKNTESKTYTQNSIKQNLCDTIIDNYFSYDNEYPRNTVIDFEDFMVEIIDYQVSNEIQELQVADKDTVELLEWIGSNLINRKINIVAKKANLKFRIEYSFNDAIDEQYDEKKVKNAEQWEKTRARWEGYTPYAKLKVVKEDAFQFPNIKWWEYYEKLRKKQMRLKDTLVNLSGESDNISTLIYKGKPAIHEVNNIYLKVTSMAGNKIKGVKYIKVYLAKGC